MPESASGEKTGTLRSLIQLARPFKKRFIFIAVLALLGTAAELIQPLIYRVAINDVAGLFVRPTTTPSAAAPDGRTAGSKRHPAAPQTKQDDQAQAETQARRLGHHRGFVAPRTSQETLTTLLWAVVILFVISVIGHWLSLASD